jgi:hypothetical protein
LPPTHQSQLGLPALRVLPQPVLRIGQMLILQRAASD